MLKKEKKEMHTKIQNKKETKEEEEEKKKRGKAKQNYRFSANNGFGSGELTELQGERRRR
jgi:hypothetical protein